MLPFANRVQLFVSLSIAVSASAAPGLAQDGVLARLQVEAAKQSRVAELAQHLTDVIGPRLTGSPGELQSEMWTAEQFRTWGLSNVRVETWGSVSGWQNVDYYGRIIAPYVQPLVASPAAGSRSTPGRVAGEVVGVNLDTVPAAAVARIFRGKLRDRFVLFGPIRPVDTEIREPFRYSEAALDSLARGVRSASTPPTAAMVSSFRERLKAHIAFDSLMGKERPLAILAASGRPYGIIEQLSVRRGTRPVTPYLAISPDQASQMWRNIASGVPVKLELQVENRIRDSVAVSNIFATLPGTTKPSEVVMIGAHLDSWQESGAADNAAGVAIVMEAMRLLHLSGVRTSRSIVVALWTGEENGILGSEHWVEKHRSELPTIKYYLNVDLGSGALRGLWIGRDSAQVETLRTALDRIRGSGLDWMIPVPGPGESDEEPFVAAGVAAYNFIQDPLDYWDFTHHTSADTYDRLNIRDMKAAAVAVAALAAELAK